MSSESQKLHVFEPLFAEANLLITEGLSMIDEALHEVDYLLNDFQPFITGKIRIEFLLIDGMLRPVAVVWRRSTLDNKWRYDKVGRKGLSKRVKKAREFSDTWEIVEGLLKQAMELMALRSNYIRAATNMRMSLTQQHRHIKARSADHILQTRLLIMGREEGMYRTFISGHSPPRDF